MYSRRSFLGGMLAIPVLTASKVEANPVNKAPKDDSWIKENPVKIWVSASKVKEDLLPEVLNMMGKYGIHEYKSDKHWHTADGAQTTLLRQLGNKMRLGTQDLEAVSFVNRFSSPDPVKMVQARQWLWNEFQKDWSVQT